MNKQRNTSWQHVSPWYKKITQDKGHYFHEHVVIPGVLKLLHLKEQSNLIDLACGTGVLARALPNYVSYVGIDIAKGLIEEAKKLDKNPGHDYIVSDVTGEITLTPSLSQSERVEKFTHATCILALQNIEKFATVFQNAAKLLQKNGTFVIVLNHPAFRIPRQSSWGIDELNKLQYRKINHYLSPLAIPITMNPGFKPNPPTSRKYAFNKSNHAHPTPPPNREGTQITWSFHQPLSAYVNGLAASGFAVTGMEEWTSDKESEGRAGKMENRSRSEIPLFLTIVAQKLL